ncbi:MAG: CPBP family intramembrane metalloprotease [Ruminococcus sp.]|nr:CPBP family intramembrane metalloprotease [Ruminococcus sp.]
MSENITPQQYRAELSNMNHEVAQLKAQVIESQTIDKYNPFDNPTEYHHYNDDYSKISPEINEIGYKIPLSPPRSEKRGIKHYYNVAGLCLVLSEILTILLFYALTYIISGVLLFANRSANIEAVENYMKSTSIYMGINMLIFMLANVGLAWFGLKIAKIKTSELFKTTSFTFTRAFQYIFIALMLQTFAAYISSGITYFFEQCGYSPLSPDNSIGFSTYTGKIMSIVYGCLVAPITEEFFYRGMLLKLFSKANQRFGIFFTAFLFGIAHGNIAQFSLGFIVGIFLAHITLKHNSIIPAIICHIAVNTKSEVLNIIYKSFDSGYFISAIITVAAALFGLIMFFEFRLKNKLPATTPAQTRRGFSLTCTCVPIIIVITYQLFNMLLSITA